jgi:hypothetical protein
MLGDDDGEQRAEHGQPPGRDRGKGQGDQPGRDQRRAIAEERPQRLAAQGQHRRFGGERE